MTSASHASPSRGRAPAWALAALLYALGAAATGCGTVPNPTLSCGQDSDCNNGRECRQGRCLLKNEFICEATSECTALLGSGTWTPEQQGACFEPSCEAGLCAIVGKAAGAACDDDDGLACTLGACDGAGGCTAGAALAAETCLIATDGTTACVAKDAPDPSNACQLCVPDISTTAWTPKPQGASCDDGDGLSCTSAACNGGGVCMPQGIASGFCRIGDACYKAGELAPASNGCKRCDPISAAEQWTELSEGSTCTVDGKSCLPGTCKAGTCVAAGIAAGACYIDLTPGDDSDTPTCLLDGDPDAVGCRACDADASQDAWTPVAAGKACGEDGIACTVDACDGKGACAATPDDELCGEKDGPCTAGQCDVAAKGCKSVPLPKTVTCEGDDFACTVEHCDDSGACDKVPVPDDALCTDAFACTLDACDAKAGCIHKAVDADCDDGNVCTADVCDAGAGCTHAANDADCTTDALPCTTQQCAEGSCKLSIAADQCVIDALCVAAGKTTAEGCKSCAPAASQQAWTLAKAGAACADDGASCTADTCTASGGCQHLAKAGACDDGLPCTLDACEPASAWADATTGCAFVDDCPYGHSCDAKAKACLTPAPVVIVAESADDPMPTNPVAVRHVLDAQTGRARLWVIYQSQPAAIAKGDAWTISQTSKLRAVILDPAIAATKADAKPKPKVVTFANAIAADTAAAFPAVAADPESSTQAWLTWLEAGVGGTPTCVDSAGRGGVVRLARLDGGAPGPSGLWSAAAGSTCPLDGGDKPGFMTPGFAVLGGAETDPGKRGGIWVRPKIDDLQSAATTELINAGSVGKGATANGGTLLGAFSTVPPVVIDTGSEDGNKARFWALALGEKLKSGVYQRELWALALDAKGVEDTPTAWVSSTIQGAGTTALAGVSAVCALDAVWDGDALEAVVVIVVRQAGEDRVWLLRGKPGGAFVATSVATAPSKGDCRSGLAAARVAQTSLGHIVTALEVPFPSVPKVGVTKAWKVSGTTATPIAGWPASEAATSDSSGGTAPSNALSYRGLSTIISSGSTLTSVVEATAGGKRAIVLHTFKP